VGERHVYIGFCWRNQKEGDHLEHPGISRMIILRWIFKKGNVGEWTGSIWLKMIGFS
jgi:hypothetical protein